MCCDPGSTPANIKVVWRVHCRSNLVEGEMDALYNVFMMTSKAIKRFGLFDENIYPAYCEGEFREAAHARPCSHSLVLPY
jgi:hypothetical protein